MKDVVSIVLEIIKELNPRANDVAIDSDSDLLAADVLDSMLTVQLVLRLEEQFKISFKFEDITPENFKCLRSISSLLESKYKANGTA